MQIYGTSERQGPQLWKSIFTFEKLPSLDGTSNGQKYNLRGLKRSNGDSFELQVSNDGYFQDKNKPGIMLGKTENVANLGLRFNGQEFRFETSRAMAYSNFVHPLGKSTGHGR